MKTKTITIERIFSAPLTKVWSAWTVPEQMKKWWGPKDFTAPSIEIDLRVGGKYLNCMRGAMAPGGPLQDFWSAGEYKEIVPLQKIVASDYLCDEHGNKIRPSEVGMPGDWPDEMLVMANFESLGEQTKIALVHEGYPEEMFELASVGWNQSLDKLEAIF